MNFNIMLNLYGTLFLLDRISNMNLNFTIRILNNIYKKEDLQFISFKVLG